MYSYSNGSRTSGVSVMLEVATFALMATSTWRIGHWLNNIISTKRGRLLHETCIKENSCSYNPYRLAIYTVRHHF